MTVTRQRQVVQVVYPEEDGKPMGETDAHRQAIIDLLVMLNDRYADRRDVYVSGDLFVYYEEGNPRAVICPDVFVAFGVQPGARRTYKLWEEGRAPTVVFEVSSRKTRREDFGPKQAACARLGVAEYFVYDPLGEYLHPPLQGFRLAGTTYMAIVPDGAGAIESKRLGLLLSAADDKLIVVDSRSGERLLGMAEQRERRLAEHEACLKAEAGTIAERQARLAEHDARRVAEARMAAERDARREAEARLERLRP
jgi:Uma2 family endonuclease